MAMDRAHSAPCRPRAGEGLSLYLLPARRLPLPPPADLLGLRRRGARPVRPVGRRLDDARAAHPLSSVGHVRSRLRPPVTTARRALVPALAIRPLERTAYVDALARISHTTKCIGAPNQR